MLRFSDIKYNLRFRYKRGAKIALSLTTLLASLIAVFVTVGYVQRQTFERSRAAVSDPPLKNIRVLDVIYVPQESYYNTPLEKAGIAVRSDQVKAAISRASAYKGTNTPSVGFKKVHSDILREFARPNPTNTKEGTLQQVLEDASGNPDGRSICRLIDDLDIDQIWLWVDPDSDKAPGAEHITSAPDSNYGDHKYENICYGVDKEFVVMGFAYNTNLDDSLHSFGHFMEMMLNVFYGSEVANKYVGADYDPESGNTDGLPIEGIKLSDTCGTIHVPPNIPLTQDGKYEGYEYREANKVNSFCENWNPESMTGQSVELYGSYWPQWWNYNDSVFNNDPFSGGFYTWWFQNLPNEGNSLSYMGKPLPNIWEYLTDMESSALEFQQQGYWYNPDLIINGVSLLSTSSQTGSSGTSVTWTHNPEDPSNGGLTKGLVKEVQAQSGYGDMVIVSAMYSTASSSDVQLNNVTYCGQAMRPYFQFDYGNRRVFGDQAAEMWFMLNPPAGSCNVQATFTSDPGPRTLTSTIARDVNVDDPLDGISKFADDAAVNANIALSPPKYNNQESFCALTLHSDVALTPTLSLGDEIWNLQPIPGRDYKYLLRSSRFDSENRISLLLNRQEEPGPTGYKTPYVGICAQINLRPETQIERLVPEFSIDHTSTIPTPTPAPSSTPSPTPTPTSGGTGSDSYISFEAEEHTFSKIYPTGTDDWSLGSAVSGFTGTGYMESVPDAGASVEASGVEASKKLTYWLNLEPGDYYVWVRANAKDGASDSVHFGVDKQLPTSLSDRVNLSAGSYAWRSTTMDGQRPVITVPSSGPLPLNPNQHYIELYAREDGARVDQILLTKDQSFVPSQGQAANTVPFKETISIPSSETTFYFEAENYDANIPRLNHTWEFRTGTAGYTGTGFMRALPDTGPISSTSNTQRPELQYNMYVPKTGRYYLWVRGTGSDGDANTIYAGIDGAIPSNLTYLNFSTNNIFSWRNILIDGSTRAYIDISSTGNHALSLYMREDGTKIDTIFLTTDPDFDPNVTTPPTINPTPAPTPSPTPVPTASPTPAPSPISTSSPTPTAEVSQTAINQITSTSNDSVEFSGNLNNTDTKIPIGGDSNYYAAMRFSDLNIPQGVRVESAYLEVHADGGWISTSYDMYADDSDSSYIFANNDRPSQRQSTTARVAHTSNVSWPSGWVRLDDISNVVQEVVSRPGWQQGNALSVILHGTGGQFGRKFVKSYDYSADLAPKLVVKYSSGSTPSPTPTPTPTPTPAPSGGSGTGLSATYYSGANSFTNIIASKVDPQINFNAGNGNFGTGLPADYFTVRWEGEVEAPATGTYTFATFSDDGVRLWVNGQQIINNWTDHASVRNVGSAYLTAGQKYSIKMEFYENAGQADARLYWAAPGIVEQLVPTSRLYPLSTPVTNSGTGLSATYYSGANSFSNILLQRVDPTVNFNVGGGAFWAGLPADYFTVRWEGEIEVPSSGAYTFATRSDDGVRLWVNGQQIINNWTDHASTRNIGSIFLDQGRKYPIKMEFYENAGEADARLYWSSSAMPEQIIPSSFLYPSMSTPAPTPTPTPPPPITAGSGTGLAGSYFDNSDLTSLVATRLDPQVNFASGFGSFINGQSVDTFSVRWEGYVAIPTSGTYVFTTENDDGARLWVNGQLLVNDWAKHAVAKSSGTISLSAGQKVPIKMEYFEDSWYATARLFWTAPGGNEELVPTEYLYPN